MLERERHFRSFHILTDVDHITAFPARLPEQTPCDRIEQGGFARAIVSRNTCQIEWSEIQFNSIVIGKKS